MAITKAQLQAEVEALRHNNEMLRTQVESLTAEIAALKHPAKGQVLPRIINNAPRRAVYEFNPNIPGDFKRASELARVNRGTVKRITA